MIANGGGIFSYLCYKEKNGNDALRREGRLLWYWVGFGKLDERHINSQTDSQRLTIRR